MIDFGLVKDIQEADTTRENAFADRYFVGTPVYASPEQLSHRSLDARADLYSLGITLFYLLTGRNPPERCALPETWTGLPRPVANLLTALLQPEAAARPHDAAEAARLIARCRAALEAPAEPAARVPGEKLPTSTTRQRLLRGGATIGMLTLLVVLAGALIRSASSHGDGVAVLPFASLTADATALASGIATDLREALPRQGALEMVPLAPKDFWQDRQGGVSFPGSPPGNLRWLFTGSVWSQGEVVEIDLRLLDTRSNRTVWGNAYKYSSRVSSFQTIRAAVGRRIAADLKTSAFPGSEHFPAGRSVPLEAATELAHGEIYFQKSTRQDNRRTIECCQRALVIAPDFARAHALLSRAYCQSHVRYGGQDGQLTLAQASAVRAIQLAPEEPEGYSALASIPLLRGRQWEALAGNRRAIEAAPGYWPALRDYGTIWIMLGHPERGLPWLRAACALEPGSVGCRCYLADAYKDLCDDDNAARCLREALSIDPAARNAMSVSIHLCMLQGRWDEARQRCREALAANPMRAISQLQAQLDLIAGDYPKAEAAFRSFLAADPTGSPMFYGGMRHASVLGFLRRQQGDDAEGNRLLEQAAALDGQDARDGPQSLYDLAATRSAQGRIREGLEALRKSYAAGWLDFRSLRIDPRFESLRASEEFWSLSAAIEEKVARMRHEAERTQTLPVRLADDPTGPTADER